MMDMVQVTSAQSLVEAALKNNSKGALQQMCSVRHQQLKLNDRKRALLQFSKCKPATTNYGSALRKLKSS
jgi:hypothetical protein